MLPYMWTVMFSSQAQKCEILYQIVTETCYFGLRMFPKKTLKIQGQKFSFPKYLIPQSILIKGWKKSRIKDFEIL